MLVPLIGPMAPSAAYAQDASPTAVESPADGTQPVTPAQPEGPALDPAPVVDEPPPVDTTAPVVTVPATLYATADAVTGTADVQFGDQIWAVDDVDGPVAVTADPASGAFAVGDTTVTVTAVDAAGNVGSATFVVSVAPAPVPTAIPEPTAQPTDEPRQCQPMNRQWLRPSRRPTPRRRGRRRTRQIPSHARPRLIPT